MNLISHDRKWAIKNRGWCYVIDTKLNGLDYSKKEDRPFKVGDEITIDNDTFKIYGIDDWHYLAHKFSTMIGIMKEDKNAK